MLFTAFIFPKFLLLQSTKRFLYLRYVPLSYREKIILLQENNKGKSSVRYFRNHDWDHGHQKSHFTCGYHRHSCLPSYSLTLFITGSQTWQVGGSETWEAAIIPNCKGFGNSLSKTQRDHRKGVSGHSTQ